MLCFLWVFGICFLVTSLLATYVLNTLRVGLAGPAHSHVAAGRVQLEGSTMTFFTAPEPFEGHVGAKQTLAVNSWLNLAPTPNIILLGTHPSILAFASSIGPQVTVDSDIDFTFWGAPMFHSMVARALRSSSKIVVLLDSDFILLPGFHAALKSLHGLDRDWLLVAQPHKIPRFPSSLQDFWLRSTELHVDNLVEAYLNHSGVWRGCESSRLWAWNANQVPLHAGVMPPFTYKQGEHHQWLLTEALVSKFRLVIDASSVMNLFQIQNAGNNTDDPQLEPSNEDTFRRSWATSVNMRLASTYGSYYFRPSSLSSVYMKLMECGDLKWKSFCLMNNSVDPSSCTLLRRAPNQDVIARDTLIKLCRPFIRALSLFFGIVDKGSTTQHCWVKEGPQTGSPSARRINLERKHEMAGCKCNKLASEYALDCVPSRQPVLKQLKLALPYSMEWLVNRVANADKVVILTVVGNSYRDFLMSWVCRLKRLQISNFLVSALDDEIYEFAMSQGLPVFKSKLDVNASRNDCHFGTECFKNVTKTKSRTVLKILRLGFNVLFSDVDVYWFQDPTRELMSFGPGHITAQSDQWNETGPLNEPRRLNSGFYFAWADYGTISAFERIISHAMVSNLSEQPSFYDVLCGEGGQNRVGNSMCVEHETNVTVHFLDRNQFPNGGYQALWETQNVRRVCEKKGCKILHNNWVNGRQKKLYRQIASGLWDYDSRNRLCVRSWQDSDVFS